MTNFDWLYIYRDRPAAAMAVDPRRPPPPLRTRVRQPRHEQHVLA
jgi:hypothetical protein